MNTNTDPIRQHVASKFDVYASPDESAVCVGFAGRRTFQQYPVEGDLSPSAAHYAYGDRLSRTRANMLLDLTLASQRLASAKAEGDVAATEVYTGAVLAAAELVAMLTADIEGLKLVAPQVASLDYVLTMEA